MNIRVCLLILGFSIVAHGEDVPKFPRAPAIEPKATPATFKTLHGFAMELIASEPLVMDPVAAAYDEDGRLYVVEMSDYPYVDKKNDKPFAENTLDPPIGRLKLLTDRDGDGRFDTSTILADKLSWPTGVVVWKGGVFVAATPTIWYFKDADGDGRAEVRERVYEGFRKYNVQAVMNNLQWGLDHTIYGAASGNGGEIRPANQPDARAISVLRRDFHFDPRSRKFETISGGARFGNTFDDWGNRFLCDIRNPMEHVVLSARYLARNPRLAAPRALHDVAAAGDTIPMFRISPPEPWREFRAKRWAANGKVLPRSELVGAGYLTSSSGVTIYRGDAYPLEFRGQAFLGEVANNLIHRESVEPDGVTFRAQRIDDRTEIIASTDTWFRPVNFVNAPDGTLHVLDMYRETIEHPWSIPDDIKAGLDLRSGEDRGRVYRITPPNFQRRETPKLSKASTAELVSLLNHNNAWHRDTAHRLIFERQDASAVPLLRTMLESGPIAHGRLHALWSLHGLEALNETDLKHALVDANATVREHAVLLAEPQLAASSQLRSAVINLATDATPRVRFQTAFTLGELATKDSIALSALATIAKRDVADPWIRTAVLSAPPDVAPLLFESLANDRAFTDRAEGLAMLRALAEIVGAGKDLASSNAFVERLAKSSFATQAPESLEVIVLGLADGLVRASHTLRDVQSNEAARTLIDRVLKNAERKASDATASSEERERAIALLGHGDAKFSKPVLAKLLDSAQPQPIQLASIRALAMSADPDIAAVLLKSWPGATPALRAEIITRLLSRPAWKAHLFDALEAGAVPSSTIPLNRRTLLLADRDTKIQARARKLFGDTTPGPRNAVFADYRASLSLTSDRSRGEAVFVRECVSCHKLGTRGNAVGPNLASIQRRTAEEVLLHIIDPNREVAPDFLEYAVSLNDGRTLTGIIAAETAASLTLRRAEGAEDVVLRTQIESIGGTGKSLMPEGLETRINKQEMADLLAFLLELQK